MLRGQQNAAIAVKLIDTLPIKNWAHAIQTELNITRLIQVFRANVFDRPDVQSDEIEASVVR